MGCPLSNALKHEHHDLAKSLSLATTSGSGTTITVAYVGPTILLYNYNTLPSNQPTSYGNTVFLWQSPPPIPWNQVPLASQPVSGNTQAGSVNFTNLQIQSKDYIAGYAVGPNIQQICSWAWIPASGASSVTFQTNIVVLAFSTDSAVVQYTVPDGSQPQANQHWVGIFQGPYASYTDSSLIVAKANVSSNVSTGTVPLSGTFLRGTQYTVAYFCGSKQTAMAAIATFTTAA
jgi:hypothetical protein